MLSKVNGLSFFKNCDTFESYRFKFSKFNLVEVMLSIRS
jgi:hypothetical protein